MCVLYHFYDFLVLDIFCFCFLFICVCFLNSYRSYNFLSQDLFLSLNAVTLFLILIFRLVSCCSIGVAFVKFSSFFSRSLVFPIFIHNFFFA